MTKIARKGCVLALALALLAPAAAFGRGPSLPKKWAKRHHLAVGHGARDTDRDGLTNRQELLAKTNPRKRDTDRDRLRDGDERRTGHDPRKRDTDGDGIKDGAERAGRIVAVSPTTVTIRLAVGGTLRARLDDDALVDCESGGGREDSPADADEPEAPGDDAEDLEDEELTDEAFAAQLDLPDELDEAEEAAEPNACSAALTPGTWVREAEVELRPDGLVLVSIDLL